MANRPDTGDRRKPEAVPLEDEELDTPDDNELDTLERLLTVAAGKPFENLSWRLLRLLIKGIEVERRQLGEGDTLKVTREMDVIYLERGSLTLPQVRGGVHQRIAAGDIAGTWPSLKYRHTKRLLVDGTYEAASGTLIRIFYKDGVRMTKSRARPRPRRAGKLESRWDRLCDRSIVARRALRIGPNNGEWGGPGADGTEDHGEVVLLTSKDLVEYLPALTQLLAQAMTEGIDPEQPPLTVRLLRLDSARRDPDSRLRPQAGPGARARIPSIEVLEIQRSVDLKAKILELKKGCDYLFVDPYDRAADLAAIQVKTLTARSRVSDLQQPASGGHPGTSASKDQWEVMLAEVDSLVHVARNFRVERPKRNDGKLHFHAVVLDSRTARFEAGGTRDWQQRRNADDPVRSNVDPPEGMDDDAPSTRLHLNLLRLKKAWEQSPLLEHVCEVLDEPNVPAAGDRRGYWSAKSFFDRWVRDLRFRRVGVALGGGGATGFSHVALLRALREENIPVDLVSGTSFGALVGAYYCSHGLDGLDMLVEQSLLYTGVASLTIFTSAFFEHLVNLSIDYRPMWELPIPLYTVATDIDTGREAVFPGPAAANPSVGFAVRASGSLPGFFAPALAGNVRYVDGGAVSIVPARALVRFGADVVIGSNAFPFRKSDGNYQPTPLRGFLPPPFGRLAERILAEINPGNRMTDAARSLSLSLASSMQSEMDLASAVYEHKRTDVKYWEFHRAGQVLRDAFQDLQTSNALPAAITAYRLLNT